MKKTITYFLLTIAFGFLTACEQKVVDTPTQPAKEDAKNNAATVHFKATELPPESSYKNPKF